MSRYPRNQNVGLCDLASWASGHGGVAAKEKVRGGGGGGRERGGGSLCRRDVGVCGERGGGRRGNRGMCRKAG